jgi:hypothetical protein
MASEAQKGVAWMFGVLSADATLKTLIGNPTRIFDGEAPQNSVFPYLVLGFQSSIPTFTIKAERHHANVVYLVKAVIKGTAYGPVREIAERADAVLHAQRGTVSGGEVFLAVGEEEIKQAYSEDGVSYREMGRYYRLLARAA